VITGITGSHTGGQGAQRWSMGEFNGGSFGDWPNTLPSSGSQTGYDVIVPYKSIRKACPPGNRLERTALYR
jgi:hypothetical protein